LADEDIKVLSDDAFEAELFSREWAINHDYDAAIHEWKGKNILKKNRPVISYLHALKSKHHSCDYIVPLRKLLLTPLIRSLAMVAMPIRLSKRYSKKIQNGARVTAGSLLKPHTT
jgi:hypothetical protein